MAEQRDPWSRFIDAVADPRTSIDLVRCFRHRAGPSWRLDRRRHQDLVIYLLLAGACRGQVASDALHWPTGALGLIAPDQEHLVEPSGPVVFHVLRVGLRRGARVLRPPIGNLTLGGMQHCEGHFLTIAEAARADDRYAARRLRAALQLLVCDIAAAAAHGQRPIGLSPRQQRLIADYLAAHIEHAPQPADLAQACGLSLDYFSRRFHQHYGNSPRRWLLHQRLQHGAALLSDGDLAIAEVAHRCGFEHPAAFSRAFHRCMGLPPRAWRQRRRS